MRIERSIRRDTLSREIRELIIDGLILPPPTYKTLTLTKCTLNAEGIIDDESIQGTEAVSDNGICE